MDNRFFAIAPAKLEPTGVIRVTENGGRLEYWSKPASKWVEEPNLLRYFTGDQPDIYEVDAAEAEALVASL